MSSEGMPAPTATYEIDRYVFHWNEDGIMATVERIHEGSDTLSAELTITSTLSPLGHLASDRLNLSSRQTKGAWIKDLNSRDLGVPIDWYAVLEQISTLTRNHYREGGALIRLSDVQGEASSPWLLDRFIPDGNVATLLFADGGSFKSLLALGACLSLCTGLQVLPGITPVRRPMTCLYLDWEWAPEVHAERLRALCAGLDMPVPENLFYRHEQASLAESAVGIRRRIMECGAGFAVVDSLGFARGADPNGAEMTIKTFAAINTFGVPVLVLDHVNKETKNAQESTGSVYTKNSVRMSWGAVVTARENESDTVSHANLRLANRKANGRWQGELSWGLELTNGPDDRMAVATIKEVDPDILEDIKAGTQQEQLAEAMEKAGAPMSIEALAAETGLQNPTIRAQLAKMKAKGHTDVEYEGKSSFWSLTGVKVFSYKGEGQ